MDEHERKYQAALKELKATRMWPSNYAPPLHWAARRLGLKTRPPHYAAFWVSTVGYAVWFGPVWGLMMWLSIWQPSGNTVKMAVTSAACVGLAFGAVMALSLAWGRRKWALSAWADL